VIGPVALHGGGEFLPGDETFLGVLLERAAVRGSDPVRIAVVPTAAARGRPHLAGANGVVAFERVATEMGLVVAAESVSVIDDASAADPALAARLAPADLIYLPGGDPDLVPTILGGSAAWAAILAARDAGAVLAGASAGAMALATWTWTMEGGMAGLGVVPGLLVVPHADAGRWASVLERFAGAGPDGLGALGLAERTGVVSDGEAIDGGGPLRWRVVGEGEVRWRPIESDRPTLVLRDGDLLETPA
jgi:cyanophycinase